MFHLRSFSDPSIPSTSKVDPTPFLLTYHIYIYQSHPGSFIDRPQFHSTSILFIVYLHTTLITYLYQVFTILSPCQFAPRLFPDPSHFHSQIHTNSSQILVCSILSFLLKILTPRKIADPSCFTAKNQCCKPVLLPKYLS